MAAALSLLVAGSAAADEVALPPPPEAAPNAGVGPAVLAAIPGLVVSGVGTWVAGDARTGKELLAIKAVALVAMAASGVGLYLTGASRRTSGAFAPLLIAGTGVSLTTWTADIYGAATGGRRDVAPLTQLRAFAASAGYAYVYDPQFDYASFATVDAVIRYRGWRATPSAWIALDDDTQRLRLAVAYRPFGPRADGHSQDGSFFEVDGAGSYHRQGDDDFDLGTAELVARGRYDLARMSPTLTGSFVEGGLGLGLQIFHIDSDVDVVDMLMAEFAYGFYLGHPHASHGTVRAFYNHRHDDFAAGLGLGSAFDGPYGHFGVDGEYWLSQRWGVRAAFEVGSAYVGNVGVMVGL